MAIDAAIARWLIEPATRALRVEDALTQLVRRLGESGLALSRVGLSMPTLHPEIWVRRLTWARDEGPRLRTPQHGLTAMVDYLDSPVAAIHAGSGPIRCRLRGPNADLRYAICRQLADKGATDYFCFPIELSLAAHRTYMSLATDHPGGFTDDALAAVLALAPYISVWLELKGAEDASRGLLEVYLGKLAATRVLAGEVHRGTGVITHAAIWNCDLRGFTAMSDTLPASEVVAALDAYFEAVAGPIADHGGEVLKFIGDAVLAIFPVGPGARKDACTRALAAATIALDAMAAQNVTRETQGKPRLDLGLALHVGEVMFGNIGARERLDFTVIGAAVNEACRMESLCKTLGTPLVVSAPFATAIGDATLIPLGEHRLRGVASPQAVFTLPVYATRALDHGV